MGKQYAVAAMGLAVGLSSAWCILSGPVSAAVGDDSSPTTPTGTKITEWAQVESRGTVTGAAKGYVLYFELPPGAEATKLYLHCENVEDAGATLALSAWTLNGKRVTSLANAPGPSCVSTRTTAAPCPRVDRGWITGATATIGDTGWYTFDVDVTPCGASVVAVSLCAETRNTTFRSRQALRLGAKDAAKVFTNGKSVTRYPRYR
jgi:hypothetical protein